MRILYAFLAIVISMVLSPIFDSVIQPEIESTTNPLVKIVLSGLDALLGIPTDIIWIIVRIAFYFGILWANLS